MNSMADKIKVKFVVLDFDLTLVDLGVNWGRTRRRVADLCRVHGLAIEQNRSLFEIMDETGSLAKSIFNIIKEEELAALEIAKPMPSAGEFLDWLFEMKIPFAVASNNHHAVIEKAFLKFEFEHPAVIIGSDDVERKKPHPEGVEKILAFLKTSAQDGILIGDSPVDAALGESVDMETLIVSPSLTFEDIKKSIV